MTLEAKIDRTNDLLAKIMDVLISNNATPAKGSSKEDIKEPTPVAESKSIEAETSKKTPAAKPAANVTDGNIASIEEAKSAFVELLKIKGKKEGVEILQTLGVSKLPDLNPSQYGELVRLCRIAME